MASIAKEMSKELRSIGYAFIAVTGQIPVRKSDVEAVAFHDETNALDIAKNHYDVIFLLKSGRDIPWMFKDKSNRDDVLRLLSLQENLGIRNIIQQTMDKVSLGVH